ncbi:hypothetical protein FBT96_13270 [Rhodobacter capsulatus]|uniref:Uncharacterized protein n=1 Tax=Rhodobacter capsulatus TaxID=1061 RepID=A0A4U1JP17_RHOCA|nr:hypothetical protein [Rhodobacter capsulatus]TKD17677.1 hypothetical protein FBT96_13270 [Rhodobacter capsulatus]
MLTPLPSPALPSPLPAGTQSLPLPHGAQTVRQGPIPLPDLPDLPDAAPTPQPRPGPAAEMPLPGATADRAAPLMARATALSAEALARATAAPQGSAATPMSLVTAQMLVDPTALQAVLAQQAATRALPGAHHRRAPHSDDPPAPLLAAADDSFDPHAPHPPPVPPGAQGTRAPPDTDGPDTTAPPTGRKRQQDPAPLPAHRPDLALPPLLGDLSARPTLWGLAGAVFTGVFVLALLLI